VAGSAAAGTLRLADLAFAGVELTDAGIAATLAKCRCLMRLNLRGCRGVSSACYNETPLRLRDRLRRLTAAEEASEEATLAALPDGEAVAGEGCAPARRLGSRKGDNLFRFMHD